MKIVFTRPDGGTSIVTPAAQNVVARSLPQVAELTEAEYLQFIIDKDVPADAIDIRIVQDNDIPTDRTFRNALKNDLTFDVDQCVEITKDRLRREREPLLAALDVQFIQALETSAPTAAIVAEKQRLRDITTLPKRVMTLEQLKALKA